jgi:photosystem II stability/assembly factor-like uncharacterized protein
VEVNLMELYLATSKGVVTAEQNEQGWQVIGRNLEEHNVTSIIAREGAILAGTKNGIFSSEDGGRTWQEASKGLTIPHVRWMAYHPGISDFELAGTEPAAIFVSRDGAKTWRECAQVSALRQKFGWWLPYSPEAGCVRGFAFGAVTPHKWRAYAAVEVGGALRSDDGGDTWRLAPGSDGRPVFGRPPAGFVHPDVHSLVVHPSSPDLVLAPTGGGFYGSTDGGETWTTLHEECYVRAVWVDPHDPAHMVLGPAEDPGGTNGRIEETRDGGQTWHLLTERWRHNMVERFTQIGQSLLAVMANGEVLNSGLATLTWQQILPDVAEVNCVTAMAS